MTVVNYNGQNTQTFRGVGTSFRFLPGANEVPNDVWEELQENESVRNFKARGKLVVVNAHSQASPAKGGKLQKVGSSEPKPLDTLADADVSKMDAWSAVALVQSIIDLNHLCRFQKQERGRDKARKTVIAALDEKIKAMEMKPGEEG